MPIEFEVMGQKAIIQSLRSSKDRWGEPTQMVAFVDFPDGLKGSSTVGMGVPLPAREFAREELLACCIGYIELKWREEQKEREKRAEQDIKADELELLVRDLTAKLGI